MGGSHARLPPTHTHSHPSSSLSSDHPAACVSNHPHLCPSCMDFPYFCPSVSLDIEDIGGLQGPRSRAFGEHNTRVGGGLAGTKQVAPAPSRVALSQTAEKCLYCLLHYLVSQQQAGLFTNQSVKAGHIIGEEGPAARAGTRLSTCLLFLCLVQS